MVNCREKDLETSGLFIHKNLFTSQNYKTVKGEKQKYKTYVLYKKSGEIEIDGKKKNSCPNKSAACYKYCLDNAGRGSFNAVKLSRLIKTKRYYFDPARFKADVINEIHRKFKWWAKNKPDWRLAFRCDGTSDLGVGRAISHSVPDSVNLYDYTKNFNVVKKYIDGDYSKNYHLTFSYSGENKKECIEALNMGVNVAVPFIHDHKPVRSLPTLWHPEQFWGYPVISGENSDLRFLDPSPSIVALKPKGSLMQDYSGFAIRGAW